MKQQKKAQIWISVVIYTMVAVVALVLILNTGIPILNEVRERAVFSKVKDSMVDLDRHISEIATQGEGSQARIAFEIRDGEIKFKDNELIWEIETENQLISPKAGSVLGNLIVSSNANVKTTELTNSFIIETEIKNDTFKVVFNKIGDRNNWVNYNSSAVISNISHNVNLMDGIFTVMINNNISTATGNGYTELVPGGNNTNLGRAKVVAHMNSSFAKYDIEYSLESFSDFVIVRIKNLQIK